jgi:hypothetical protein
MSIEKTSFLGSRLCRRVWWYSSAPLQSVHVHPTLHLHVTVLRTTEIATRAAFAWS